jgi:hypothetical protein
MDIGNQLVNVTGGSGDAGTVLHMKGHTGVTRTMTTTEKVGKCTRDIGTMRTTTMATGETMIMIATIMITTIVITTTMTTMTTDRYALMRVELAFDNVLVPLRICPNTMSGRYIQYFRRIAAIARSCSARV